MITDMPLTRLLSYYHAALWVNGAWTVKQKAQDMGRLEELFAARPNESED
jgi:hypothetical protein